MICRLRLWVELLKHAYFTAESKYQRLETLPNIDINIKSGNSLVSRFALDEDLTDVFRKQKFSHADYLLAVQSYKNVRSKDGKEELRAFIQKIKDEFRQAVFNRNPFAKALSPKRGQLVLLDNNLDLFGEAKKDAETVKKEKAKLHAEITALESQLEEYKSGPLYRNSFEWRFEFPEVLDENGDFEGFDVVIANPPYIQHRELAYISTYLKANYRVYSGTSDISSYFFERFISVLKPKGIISAISSNKFFNAEYGKSLRSFLSNYNFLTIVNFEQVPIFEEALVSSAIFLISKEIPSKAINYIKFFKEKVVTLNDKKELDERKYMFSQLELKNASWLFNDFESNEIINKIKVKGIPIGEIPDIEIKRGLTTGFDNAYLIDKKKFESLIENQENSKSIIKKVLKGEHINRYKTNFQDLWIINTHNGIKGTENPIDVENDFPLIFQHLQAVNVESGGKVENRSDKGKHWTNLRSCAFLNDFQKPKIVWGLISGNWGFAYDEMGYFLTSASFFLISNRINLKFILGLLNSALFRYYFIQVGEYTAGGAFVLKKTSIEKFIIPTVAEKEQDSIIQLVEQILDAKNKGDDSSSYEQDIDRIVYQLYDLTPEEIKVIELQS
jgi:hypothetical protein